MAPETSTNSEPDAPSLFTPLDEDTTKRVYSLNFETDWGLVLVR